ncbi:MAG: helix-hairpin-helix domain-containing protein [Acidimicrobiia bacterium]|jgi:predicted flap endonuclease-1-like 5' DNA nuclease
MNKPLKQILRVGGVVVGLGAAVWALRDKLLPAPEIPAGPPPRFRTTPPSSASADDLTEVKGVGPVYAQRLVDAGITSFVMLANADVAAVAGAANVSESQAASWIGQAANHT